ncbi:hypothetical protein N431DRAFT_517990 [Stipitochalara longipes BDJ]|nr:hypothetical protein N431DRAFT_517990 [Stipitochalara longipes BDJ]
MSKRGGEWRGVEAMNKVPGRAISRLTKPLPPPPGTGRRHARQTSTSTRDVRKLALATQRFPHSFLTCPTARGAGPIGPQDAGRLARATAMPAHMQTSISTSLPQHDTSRTLHQASPCSRSRSQGSKEVSKQASSAGRGDGGRRMN